MWLVCILTEFYQAFVDKGADSESNDSHRVVKEFVLFVFTLLDSFPIPKDVLFALEVKGCKGDTLAIVSALESLEDRTLEELVVEGILVCRQPFCHGCLVLLCQPIASLLWIGGPILRLLIYLHEDARDSLSVLPPDSLSLEEALVQ